MKKLLPTRGEYPETLKAVKSLAFLEPFIQKFQINGDTILTYDNKYEYVKNEAGTE